MDTIHFLLKSICIHQSSTSEPEENITRLGAVVSILKDRINKIYIPISEILNINCIVYKYLKSILRSRRGNK